MSSLHTYYDSNAVEVTAGSTAGHVSGITIGARSYNGTAGSDAVALWTETHKIDSRCNWKCWYWNY